jgi:hypothetical protein
MVKVTSFELLGMFTVLVYYCLRCFTGRSPTDDMFKDSLDLHIFAVATLPNRAMEIADPTIWLHEEAKDVGAANVNMLRSRREEWLVSATALGVSCSERNPRENTDENCCCGDPCCQRCIPQGFKYSCWVYSKKKYSCWESKSQKEATTPKCSATIIEAMIIYFGDI